MTAQTGLAMAAGRAIILIPSGGRWLDFGARCEALWLAGGAIGDTPPLKAAVGDASWGSVGGQLYVWYDDGSSAPGGIAINQPGPRSPMGMRGPPRFRFGYPQRQHITNGRRVDQRGSRQLLNDEIPISGE